MGTASKLYNMLLSAPPESVIRLGIIIAAPKTGSLVGDQGVLVASALGSLLWSGHTAAKKK